VFNSSDRLILVGLNENVSNLASRISTINSKLGVIMSTLSDLQAADAAIKSAIASAITLIQSLHMGAGGSVSDADVEAVVSDLNAAATALGAATPQP
jgi:hypothetical protein